MTEILTKMEVIQEIEDRLREYRKQHFEQRHKHLSEEMTKKARREIFVHEQTCHPVSEPLQWKEYPPVKAPKEGFAWTSDSKDLVEKTLNQTIHYLAQGLGRSLLSIKYRIAKELEAEGICTVHSSRR